MVEHMLVIQKALIGALAGLTAPSEATGAPAVPVAVYDTVPQGAPFPFVVIRDHEASPADTYDQESGTHAVELVLYSQYRGQRQVIAALAAVKARLHQVELALEDGVCVGCIVTRVATSRDPDGLTVLGSVSVGLTVENEDT